MARVVSLRLPRETVRRLDRHARERGMTRAEALRRLIDRGLRETRLDLAMELLQAGQVSREKAAEIAGVGIYDILEQMRLRRIPGGYTAADLARDLHEFGLARERSD